MDPITGLAYGRVTIGALTFLSPSLATRLFLLDPSGNPQLSYVARLFAAREIALGALTLASSGAARRRLVQLGVAVDSADVLTGLLSAASGSVPKKTGLMLAVAGAASVAAGVSELPK